MKRLIVTHPLLDPQFTWMSIEQLKEAAISAPTSSSPARAVTAEGEPKRRALAA